MDASLFLCIFTELFEVKSKIETLLPCPLPDNEALPSLGAKWLLPQPRIDLLQCQLSHSFPSLYYMLKYF